MNILLSYKFLYLFEILAELFINARALFWVSTSILTVGYFWHLIARISDCATLAFSRSGALLVMLAILTIAVNHLLSQYVSVRDKKFELLNELAANDTKVKQAIERKIQRKTKNPSRSAKTANENADSITSQFTDLAHTIGEKHGKESETIRKLSADLMLVEIGAGLAGTFVWGFGDIIMNILSNTGAFIFAFAVAVLLVYLDDKVASD